MTATIHQLHASAPAPQRCGLNLEQEEVQEASGGYAYPARQLRELHARGFVLATIGRSGQVVLPRAHYDAVVRGQYRPSEPVVDAGDHPVARPNRARLERRFADRRRK